MTIASRIALGMLAAGLALASLPVRAEVHALLIANSAYKGPPPLTGVARDADNAAAIARLLGATSGHVKRLDNADLATMERAFADLIAEVGQSDKVFLYFSGHGGRWNVASEGRCAESLVSIDGKHFPDTSFERVVNALAAKAEKVFVFIDACHSGGIASRSASAQFTPKYWEGESGKTCSKPTNVLSRGISPGGGNPLAGNIVMLAAARDDEVAFDGPDGGIASIAWKSCLEEGRGDVDGSGGLTARELLGCAQVKVDRALSGNTDSRPPHIDVKGNGAMVLRLADPPRPGLTPPGTPQTAQIPPSPAAPAPAPTPVAPPQPVATAPELAPEPEPTVAPSPMNTLNDIYNRRDARRQVMLKSAAKELRIDGAPLDLTLTSSHAGYVYLLMLGSDQATFDLLFPNKLDGDNRIAAGKPMKLPRSNWMITAKGPEGTDRLLAIVSEQPRDFAKSGMTNAGAFSILHAKVPGSGRDLQKAALSAAGSDCSKPGRCSNAYGAAMLDIVEVP